MKALLGVPDGWATVGMVPIGYPLLTGHGPITRKPPSVDGRPRHLRRVVAIAGTRFRSEALSSARSLG